MKPIEIPSLEDERVFIPFTLPVKGRKPLSFKVPRRDFVAPEDIKTVTWLMAELDFDRDRLVDWADPDEPVAVEKACFLIALKPYVTEAQFKTLKAATFGQLRFINDRWNEQSRVTVGEYWASASSSTSTQRPSNTTSSSADGEDGTSGDDSDGQSSEA